jgi:hypothetical protein
MERAPAFALRVWGNFSLYATPRFRRCARGKKCGERAEEGKEAAREKEKERDKNCRSWSRKRMLVQTSLSVGSVLGCCSDCFQGENGDSKPKNSVRNQHF